jgi:hypothetical protein
MVPRVLALPCILQVAQLVLQLVPPLSPMVP